jgi:siroheme synthase-like protein
VRVIRKEYDSGDLALGDYVVAAVGVRDIDRQIAQDCRAAGIPVNVVDDIEFCDFIFPSIVKRGKLTVAISTSGSSPLYARMLRQQLEEMLPENIEQVLDEMQELRERTVEEVADQKERARIYKKALLDKLT